MKRARSGWSFPVLVACLVALSATNSIMILQSRALRTEADALKATVKALREDGDGSCAVSQDGVRVVCWMEGGGVKLLQLKPGDVIVARDCLSKKRRQSCAR